MSKVLLISGSPRPRGNTEFLLNECKQVLESNGVGAELVSLAGMKIESCIACSKCAKLGECGLDDGLNPIIRTLRGCQGLIVGTPVYLGTARGDVMCALQRIGYVSRRSDQFLASKVGGAIAVAGHGGQTLTLQEMQMFFLISDMVVPGSTYWNMAFGRKPGDVVNDEFGRNTIRHFAANVARLVKKLYPETGN